MISSEPESSIPSRIVGERIPTGRTLAELCITRKLGSSDNSGNNVTRRGGTPLLVKEQRQSSHYAGPSTTSYINIQRCRDLSCQKITEKLLRSSSINVDEQAYSQQLQEALLDYQRVLGFSQAIGNTRIRSNSNDFTLGISTATSGMIVYTMVQSIQVLKNAPFSHGETGKKVANTLSSLICTPVVATCDNLLKDVCCLVVNIVGLSENAKHYSAMQKLRPPTESSSSNTLVFDMTRDQVETCLDILSEQCHQVIQKRLHPCMSTKVTLVSLEYLLVMIKCIGCILQRTPSSSLPAPERTAQSIVSKVLLQVIDHGNASCMIIMTNTSIPKNSSISIVGDPCITKLHEAAHLALDIISWLVKIKHYAIALLCPLVVEVSTSGQERSLSNPTRRNMVQAIQTAFAVTPLLTPQSSNMGTSEVDDDNVLLCQRLVYHACLALVSIVEAAYIIQRSNLCQETAKTDVMILVDMDGSSVARRIRALLLTGNRRKGYEKISRQGVADIGNVDNIVKLTRIMSLTLLTSIARSCSFLISSHWELFLSEHEPSHFSLQESDGRKSSPLLALLQSRIFKYDHDEIISVLSAIEELIRNMPFKQMLTMANIKMNQHKSVVVLNITTSSLSSRHLVLRMYGAILATIEALADELDASWSRFLSKSGWKEDEIIFQIFGVVRTIMTNVPFGIEGVSSGLNDGTVRLLSISSRIFFDATTTSAPAMASPDIQSAAASTLMSSMGGKITQSGSLTLLPMPTRMWLHQNTQFVVMLQKMCCTAADSLRDFKKKPPIFDCLDILQSILRVAPWAFVVGENQRYVMNVIVHHLSLSRDSKIRLKVCDLVRSLLMGRQDFGNNEEARNIDFSFVCMHLVPALCAALKDQDSLVRASAASALGMLNASDWLFFCGGQETVPSANHCLSQVIDLCKLTAGADNGSGKDKKKLASMRAEACKSLGNICSTVFGPEIENHIGDNAVGGENETLRITSFCRFIYIEASKAMLYSCRDQNASVRGMAIFAVGNLSRALNEAKVKQGFQQCSLHLNLCNASLSALSDENEKVVGQAIRTMGHLIVGLFALRQYNDTWADENGVVELCGAVAECLAARIQPVLSDASFIGGDRPTWRQRSNAKKHAWGACSGLAPLLSNRISSRKSIARKVASAIESLVGCLDLAPVLNAKIVSSAVSTLRTISVDVWRCFSGEERVFGSAIKACVGILSSSETRCRLYGEHLLLELSALLSSLLVLANWKDYLILIDQEEEKIVRHEFLYFWLVENYRMNSDEKSYVFQSVKTALETQQQHSNVLLLQKFASRALNEQRKAESSGYNRSEVVDALRGRSLFHSADEDSEDEL